MDGEEEEDEEGVFYEEDDEESGDDDESEWLPDDRSRSVRDRYARGGAFYGESRSEVGSLEDFIV